MPTLSTIEPPSLQVGQDPAHWLESLQAPFLWNLIPSIRELTSPSSADAAKKQRKIEFASGRRSAESLLKRLGSSQQVWVNADRSPDWPNGFVGSISHSKAWTWTAVARQTQLKSIGIDTETVVTTETRNKIQQDVVTEFEWQAAQSIGLSANQIFSLVFSAKETFYKCWYPLTQRYFGFEHALVESATSNSLTIRMSESNPNFGCEPESIEVLFFATDNDVFTTTWMEKN